MATREEEYSRVRELLDYPIEQRPNPHQIFGELYRQEQLMLNEVNNRNVPFAINTVDVTTIADQAEYSLTPGASKGAVGKPLFVSRTLTNGEVIRIPFTDLVSAETVDPTIYPTVDDTLTYPYLNERLAFSRTGYQDQSQIVTVYPTPNEIRTYKITYGIGEVDRTQKTEAEEVLIPELSDFRCITVAKFLCVKAEWAGYQREDNRLRRGELMVTLDQQLLQALKDKEDYLDSLHNDQIDEVGYWDD